MSTSASNPFESLAEDIAERVKRAAIEGAASALSESNLRQIVREEIKAGSRVSYSEEEAAHELGMKPSSLAKIRGRGEIEYARPNGKTVRYSRKALDKFLEKRTV